MVKPEWGLKRTCNSCGAHFYDMTRSPIICPKCGAVVDIEAVFKTSRRSVAQEKASARANAKKIEEIEVDDLDDVSDDDDLDADKDESDLIEDTSDLGGDDDDMAEVMDRLDEKPADEI